MQPEYFPGDYRFLSIFCDVVTHYLDILQYAQQNTMYKMMKDKFEVARSGCERMERIGLWSDEANGCDSNEGNIIQIWCEINEKVLPTMFKRRLSPLLLLREHARGVRDVVCLQRTSHRLPPYSEVVDGTTFMTQRRRLYHREAGGKNENTPRYRHLRWKIIIQGHL